MGDYPGSEPLLIKAKVCFFDWSLIKEEDLKVVPIMHAAVNEEIKARFKDSEQTTKSFTVSPDNLSNYII